MDKKFTKLLQNKHPMHVDDYSKDSSDCGCCRQENLQIVRLNLDACLQMTS
jgi:hypothetical protein